MLCPLCHGHRLFYLHGQLLPCPECEGHGEIHCCDGLREQPEANAQDDQELRAAQDVGAANKDDRTGN